MPHIRALDGLRGLAVLIVVLFHFAPKVAPGGFLGVDLFFVLSGFLITSLLVRELQKADTISLLAFWARRARRLLPALFLVLLGVGVYVLFLADPVEAQRIADDGLGAFGYVANWHFIAQNESYIQRFITEHGSPSPFRHMWSLAIEEQFYVLWPLVVLGASRLFRSRGGDAPARGERDRSTQQQWFTRSAIAGVCVILGLVSVAWMAHLYKPGGDPSRVYYGTDTHASLLLFGSALGALAAGAVALRGHLQQRALVVAGCGAALGLAVLVATIDANGSWLYQGGYLGIAVLLVVLLAAAGQPGVNPLRRVFELRPLVGLGVISYGVYLWHWPLFVWITPATTGLDGVALFMLRSVATLVVSLASFYLVEQPIRRGWTPRLTKTPGVAPAAIATVVAIVLLIPALAVPEVADVSASSTTANKSEVAADYSAAPRCDGGSLSKEGSNALAGQRVMLIGNSVAEEVRACLGAIVASRGAKFSATQTDNAAILCEQRPALRNLLRDPSTRPTVAIVFWVPAVRYESCPDSVAAQTEAVVNDFLRVGARVVLVPMVPKAGRHHPPVPQKDYEKIAAKHPQQVSVIDAGVFVRDNKGVYQWRMPCFGNEPGCEPDGTVAVRNPADDGLHFCADPEYNFEGHPCPGHLGAGQRRASSAVAQGFFAVFKPPDPG